MEHLDVAHFLGMLVIILAMAKVAGALAQTAGQPSVLGELVGGVLIGPSILGWIDPHFQTLQLLSELGVLILLFAIGLETDLSQLLKVGGTSITVAVVGVVLPFLLGYLACRLLGLADRVAIMAAATLTATSVGITARVLSDLGRLRDTEGQIILGAAVIDDILGLLILTVVTARAKPGRSPWVGSSGRPAPPSASSSRPCWSGSSLSPSSFAFQDGSSRAITSAASASEDIGKRDMSALSAFIGQIVSESVQKSICASSHLRSFSVEKSPT